MHGICDQQKADEQALRSEYEEKIREIHAEYKERNDKNKGFDRMRGGSTNNHQVLEVRKSLQMLQKLADALHSELSQKYDSSPNQQKRQMLGQYRQKIHEQIDRVNQVTAAMSTSSTAAPNSEMKVSCLYALGLLS